MEQGTIAENDLHTFPSDHAGFFLAIAVGILLANRAIGFIAVVWTLFVPLLAKLVLGQHTPLDIISGGAIGVVVLLITQAVLHRWGSRLLNPIADWTIRNSAISAALLFIVVFEVTSTLDDVHQFGKVGKEIVKAHIERTT